MAGNTGGSQGVFSWGSGRDMNALSGSAEGGTASNGPISIQGFNPGEWPQPLTGGPNSSPWTRYGVAVGISLAVAGAAWVLLQKKKGGR